MTKADIITYRLINQQIAKSNCHQPEDVVAWLVAMQAQEYAMAKWAVGLRMPQATDALVEQAFNEGSILRTHLMRPTWHFVTPRDIRWMIALTAPRVNALNAYYYKKCGLDNALFKRAGKCLSKALQGGNMLTRTALQARLKDANIAADGMRLAYILMNAELDALICSGTRIGKQFSYALLEERVAPAKALTREEALAKLVKQYFQSRGPASLYDFVYWSGLSMEDAKAGAASLPSGFEKITLDKKEYFFIPGNLPALHEAIGRNKRRVTFLMPDYDEYGMSYKNREAIAPSRGNGSKAADTSAYNHWIVVNGQVNGTWQKNAAGNTDGVTTVPYNQWNKTQSHAVAMAVKRWAKFSGNESSCCY